MGWPQVGYPTSFSVWFRVDYRQDDPTREYTLMIQAQFTPKIWQMGWSQVRYSTSLVFCSGSAKENMTPLGNILSRSMLNSPQNSSGHRIIPDRTGAAHACDKREEEKEHGLFRHQS
jgi:hypothetical protein